MADVPFILGIQSVFKFFIDGKEIILNAKSWSVKANVTKIADGVNGEERDRLDRTVNYFEITADCYQRNTDLLEAAINDIVNDDQSVTPLEKAGGCRLKIRDGSRKAFLCKEIILDDFDINASGRSDRTMVKLNFRCRYFESVRSA